MPEKVKKTITEINAEVDILATKEEHWGAEVMARVIDLGSIGNAETMAPEAVGLAYKMKSGMSDEEYHRTKNECVIPDPTQENVWYVHVKVFRRKQ